MLTAIIPARAGSRRLIHKNVVLFEGVPLLVRKIRQLKQTTGVDAVLVSSDSDQYLEMATAEGAITHKRGEEWSDEKTHPFGARVRHIVGQTACDHILWAPCTSPLVNSSIYSAAIATYPKAIEDGFDSLMSVQPFQRYVWDDKGPINYQLGLGHVPSQELPVLYFIADAIQIAPREKMLEWAYFHGPNPYRFHLSKQNAVDIDDELDLKCAQAWV